MSGPPKPLDDWSAIAAQISAATGTSFRVQRVHSAGGGCINSAMLLEGAGLRYFVKLNHAPRLAMFEAEAAGLDELGQAGAVKVPQVICCGADHVHAWLVLEYLDISARRGDWARLGVQLAQLHRRVDTRYGWTRENTIGATTQINTPASDWIEFWRDRRLGFQLRLAERNGYRGQLQSLGAALMERVGDFFPDSQPPASLLHGDLWSGNAAFLIDGEAVIFDPAVYYGDREADLAMTELFGGFPEPFYRAYRSAWPVSAGYRVRKQLYNLYHLLNHLNLFGAGYRAQCEASMASLLSEIR